MTAAAVEARQQGDGLYPIPPAILPQIAPSTYLLSHLTSSAELRPCGRKPGQTRSIGLNAGSLTNANGSALVRLGNTSVVCGVRAEVLDVRDIANYRPLQTTSHRTVNNASTPGRASEEESEEADSEILNHSLLVPNIELQTGASPLPAYQPSSGAPSSLAQSLSQRLLSSLHSSHLVRPSDLRIHGTDLSSDSHDPAITVTTSDETSSQVLKGYWTLYIDILLLSHDGSIFDAAFMALVAALHDTILPKAWFDFDAERIVCSPEAGDARHLKLRGTAPVSLSWKVFVDREAGASKGIVESRKWVLLDPDSFEEESGACQEGGCIVVDRTANRGTAKEELKILKFEKNGGPIVNGEHLADTLKIAAARWNQWHKVLQQMKKS